VHAVIALLLILGAADATVEARVLEKRGTVTPTVSAVWLDRFDLRASPGVAFALTHYVSEIFAIDYVSGAYLRTVDLPQAVALRESTGFAIDRAQPIALVTAGVRVAFAYGKAMIERTGAVLHFSPEVSAHVGTLITDRGAYPAADVGLGLRVLLASRLTLYLDYKLVLSLEGRPVGLVVGGMPSLGLGWMF
jgi:hypothetical protein